MALLGLFVGIDRYASTKVNWLSCAKHDAIALHALFTDTLGCGGLLLTDQQATRATIEKHFQELAQCDPDDVVVITFSGHGSQTHELITHDADPWDLPNTAIPLNTLVKWFSCIPSRRLLCVLDCCFSGGMGARVFVSDAVPRSPESAANLLDQLSGQGRLILTASTATEPAWETNRFGHGLLTYHLLEALQGAEEVRDSGKISVYRLLEYVTKRVIDGAAQFGKPQHPTLRGQLDGELMWPVFQPGATYYAAFPERAPRPVTSDVMSLEEHGFPAALLHAWAGSIPGLNQLQIDAINDFGLLQGEHLVVSAPTSSGKNLVVDVAHLSATLPTFCGGVGAWGAWIAVCALGA